MRYSPEQQELLEHLVKVNSVEFNVLKAVEECGEFVETIVKRNTKSKANPRRPQFMEVIHEFGDVVYRGIVAVMQETGLTIREIDTEVQKHVNEKLEALQGWREKGEYKGGL